MKKHFNYLLLLAIVLTILSPITAYGQNDRVTLTILGTSDIHGALTSWGYEDNKDNQNAGLVRIAGLYDQVIKENPNTILIDSGDTIQGTILTDDIYNLDYDSPHPIIELMNAIPYTSMTLGNHEFNFGLDLIHKINEEANFPILSANIYNKSDGSNFMTPYIITEVGELRVAILGLTVPSIPRWDGPHVQDLEFRHMAEEARKYVDMINEEGADVIIVSAHAGLESRYEEDGADAAKYILETVPEINVLAIGHDHRAIAEEMNGILVGAPAAGSRGNDVTRFDLTLENQNGVWTVVEQSVKNIPLSSVEPSERAAQIAEEAHQRTLNFLSDVIGYASGDFHPESEVPGIPTAQIMDTAVIDLINEVQLKYTGADVSAAALFRNDSNIKEGPITYSDIFGIYRFPNTLYGVEVTGAELKEFMEWSASYFNTYTEGDVTISFDPNVRAYNYDMFAGVEYNIDISRPAGERIVNLTFNGNPIEDDQILKLAVNNYRFGGLQNMGLISREEYFKSDPVSLRSLIRDYIKEQGTIDPVVDNNWSIIGADLDHPLREEIIQLVRDGKIEIPVSEDGRTPNVASLNVYRLAEQGLITLDGVESSDSTKEETVEVPVITEPTAALSTNYEVYTVVPGDVLWRIANRHNTDWRTIANFNSLANPNLIFPNQNLKIPVQ